MLAAAVELARYPALAGAPLHGSARSVTCGSTLDLDLCADAAGAITELGLRVRACAVGQASAAIFARHAAGQSLGEIAAMYAAMQAWLESDGPQPDWPDISLIAPARDFRGRHGAMLLPWKAAVEALSSLPSPR
ncbi:MAG: iron-sulfur cluster assembly scaffold protein [Erythrobacter sp.]|nr:MAG: iron-sulfur cluster assembly scaffold protein [Erythrobacter sp.]